MAGKTALIQERCFYSLEAPIARVAGFDTPYPQAFEWDHFPGPGRWVYIKGPPFHAR